jgi:3-oxoacyl-[acyl-carrier-protein] synthase-3
MIVAESLILSGASKRTLLIGGEILTRITNWTDRSSCVLFGDAAGAAVLEESKDESGMLSHYWKADGSLGQLLYQPAGGTRLPASEKTVAENLHTIQMKGNEVFKHAVKRMGEAAAEALKLTGRFPVFHAAETRCSNQMASVAARWPARQALSARHARSRTARSGWPNFAMTCA